LKDARWDVRAFSVLSEASKSSLPADYAFFTESGALNDALLKNNDVGIVDWLKGSGEGQEFFESLVITDMGGLKERPANEDLIKFGSKLPKDRRLTLTCRIPSTSKSAKTVAALTLAINLADALASGKISLESTSRIMKRRQEILSVALSEHRKELEEEAQEKAAERKKLEEDAKYNAMSPAAQKKKDELEKKRQLRKSSMKQAKVGKA